ncbi:MAG: hypothetical protein EOM70_07205 [Clostridia bacterium]|nr:hypothetical protein [Clostridia bacterium]
MSINPERLLESKLPWVTYRTLRDLVRLPEDEPEVRHAKDDMIHHPLVTGLIQELADWPGIVLNSHKSAGQLYHKLAFLADLGLVSSDADFTRLIQHLEAQRDPHGLFQLPTQIPVHFGGSGQETWAWALCDAPLILYSVVKMNLISDRVDAAVLYLLSQGRDNGWPCTVSPELGSFRGPGRKNDPCPYATLTMLQLLSLKPAWRDSDEARAGVETLLGLWENSLTKHPYLFYMGTDFRKLKAPFIWYDILHVLDVLSQFPPALGDPRLQSMLAAVQVQADAEGWYTPQSVWKAWAGWDFGQKKVPSPYLTFLINRIEKRLEGGTVFGE